jgi:hypothetical protein
MAEMESEMSRIRGESNEPRTTHKLDTALSLATSVQSNLGQIHQQSDELMTPKRDGMFLFLPTPEANSPSELGGSDIFAGIWDQATPGQHVTPSGTSHKWGEGNALELNLESAKDNGQTLINKDTTREDTVGASLKMATPAGGWDFPGQGKGSSKPLQDVSKEQPTATPQDVLASGMDRSRETAPGMGQSDMDDSVKPSLSGDKPPVGTQPLVVTLCTCTSVPTTFESPCVHEEGHTAEVEQIRIDYLDQLLGALQQLLPEAQDSAYFPEAPTDWSTLLVPEEGEDDPESRVKQWFVGSYCDRHALNCRDISGQEQQRAETAAQEEGPLYARAIDASVFWVTGPRSSELVRALTSSHAWLREQKRSTMQAAAFLTAFLNCAKNTFLRMGQQVSQH